jgi:hypothetical protein
VQEKDGKLGELTGAVEWEKKAEALGGVGDVFDMGSLFLQLCLVMGAVALVMQGDRIKRTFFWVMIILGAIGTFIAVKAIWAGHQIS